MLLFYPPPFEFQRQSAFSYFVNPGGYIGKSTSYELGIAQVSSVRCFFLEKPEDHPAYFHKNSIWQAEKLVEIVKTYNRLPEPKAKRNEIAIHKLWEELMVLGSVVAVGGIIEYDNPLRKEKEVLRTHLPSTSSRDSGENRKDQEAARRLHLESTSPML